MNRLEPVVQGEVVEELPVERYIDEGPNYVRFDKDTPFEVWYAYFRHLERTEKGYMFWIGDALNFGENAYGEIAAQADASQWSRDTYYKAKSLCKRIEPCRRRQGLSFSHHDEVAALELGEQDKWLDAAEPQAGVGRPRLSQKALREAIKEEARRRREEAAEAAENAGLEEEAEQGALTEAEGDGAEEKPKPASKSKPAPLPVPDIEEGEWWRLGEHILFCGSSASDEFKDSVAGTDAALAFADPPYNAGVAHWDHGFFWEHDYLVDVADVVAVTPGIASLFDFSKVTNMPYRWSLAGFISNGMTRGAVGYGNWIYAGLFSRKGVYRQAQDAVRFSIKTSETKDSAHRGRKPAELMAYVVDTFSKKAETVVDPFLGSGSTLFACENLGRRCVGAELEPEYCRAIVSRWQKASKTAAERVA